MISGESCLVIGGCVAVLCVFLVKKIVGKITAARKVHGVEPLLTMEQVISLVTDYLNGHKEVNSVAVTVFEHDNLPSSIGDILKGEFPTDARHMLILVAVKNDEPEKTIAVIFARELEISLKKLLEEGLFKIER